MSTECDVAAVTRLESIGASIPSRVVRSEELLDALSVDKKPPLVEVTGVKERRVADSATASVDLAVDAALDALSRSEHAPESIDLVINCSITRYAETGRLRFAPSMAAVVRDRIGAVNASAFDVANACAGMATGLEIADRMIRAGSAGCVLVVSGETCTEISRTAVREISEAYDPQFAALSVGDSGCCLVVDGRGGPDDAVEAVSLTTAAEAASLCVAMPSAYGEGIAMYTDNKRMHSETRYTQGLQFVKDRLAAAGTTLEDSKIDYLVHHQFSTVAMDLLRRLGEDKVFQTELPPELKVIDFLGNTSSTALFMVIFHHLDTGVLQPGNRLLIVPSASGMVYGYISIVIGKGLAWH